MVGPGEKEWRWGEREEGGRRRKAPALTDVAANQHHLRVMRQPFSGNYRPQDTQPRRG